MRNFWTEVRFFWEDLRDDWENFGSRVLKISWCVILTLSLVKMLSDGKLQKNLAVMANLNWLIVLENLVMIVVVVSSFVGLTKLHPFFGWSWFSLFKNREDEANGREPRAQNINVMPMRVKYFGLIFALLLMVNLPSLAMFEEKWFRAGTDGWLEGLCISFLFGIAHCLVGVPIGAGIAITLAGLWFTHQYFMGGVELSALHHATFNLIIVSVLFLELVLKHIVELTERKV